MNNFIKKNLYTKTKNINPHINKKMWWKKRNIIEEYNEILRLTPFLIESAPMKERIFCILNNINKSPTCYCREKLKFYDKHFAKFCSQKCSKNSYITKEKYRRTCLSKFGETTNLKTDECKEKIRKTNQLKYGVDNYSQFHISPKTFKNLNNQIWLNWQYNNEDKTTKEIANMLGDVTIVTVLKYLKKI